LWREIGLGLGIGLLGLILTAFAIKAGGDWPNANLANPPSQSGSTVTPALFSPGTLPTP
jgi:hypothetical protein